MVLRLLAVVASLAAEHGLQVQGLQQLQVAGLAAPWLVESSWTRDRSGVPCFGSQIVNHWGHQEVLNRTFNYTFICIHTKILLSC